MTTQTTNYAQRNVPIDILRALTMFVMIFVNDFWKVHDIPTWMDHAKRGEDFLGLADAVFPCFLFVVGMSIPFAIERRYSKGNSDLSTIGHILSRSLALLVMGAFITNSEARLSPDVSYRIGVYWFLMFAGFICIWNQYPKTDEEWKKRLFFGLKIVGWIILLFLAITFRSTKGNVFNASWGILGSIGWTYLLCAFIYIFSRDRLKYLIPFWVAFVIICILGSKMNEAHGGEALLALPRPNLYNEMLNILHIGNGALPAFTMGGIILSIISTRYRQTPGMTKLIWVLVAVGVLLVAGVFSRNFWILSKMSATPTWIFFVMAIAITTYAILYKLVDMGKASWFNIIKPAGMATLTTYTVPYVAYGLADVTGIILPDWFTHGFLSIINCLCFALVIIGVTWVLGRIHIKLKV
ncbi:membrane protein [Bacteroidia bacterium]|nr:membrane protein [Bacteroidia bacterium]